MKILLTGFEAFGSVEENPTQVIVERMAHSNHLPDHIDLVCEILPVEYEASHHLICGLIDRCKPDAVIMTGVAAKRDKINVEFWARNIRDGKIPDNSGVLIESEPIIVDKSTEHFLPSTLPVFSIYNQLKKFRIPVERSNNAGAYVCNNVFYCAIDYLKKTNRDDVLAGFIHIPTFEAISRENILLAYHHILETVASAKKQKHLEANCYMSPAIEAELNHLYQNLPVHPTWCSLVSIDGILIGHVGEDFELDRIAAIVAASEGLSDRISSEINKSDFAYTILGGQKGVFFVFRLNEGYLMAINWANKTSISSVYLATKALPQLTHQLIQLLD